METDNPFDDREPQLSARSILNIVERFLVEEKIRQGQADAITKVLDESGAEAAQGKLVEVITENKLADK